MAKFTVKITDSKDNHFRIALDLPYNVNTPGDWSVLDKGFISFDSGTTQCVRVTGHWYEEELRLISSEGTWGLQLTDFQGPLWVCSKGDGRLLQPWALSAEPGNISWVRTD